MMDNEADYTITFRSLSKIIENDTQKFLSQFKQKTLSLYVTKTPVFS